jgi:hypothetical protein
MRGHQMKPAVIIGTVLFAIGIGPVHAQTYAISSSAQFAWYMAELFESEDACASRVTVDYDKLSVLTSRYGLAFDPVYQRDLPRYRDRFVKQEVSFAGSDICSHAMRDFGPTGGKIPGLLYWK